MDWLTPEQQRIEHIEAVRISRGWRRRAHRSWQVAEMETRCQIVTGRTPRWYKVLAAVEIWIRRLFAK